MPNKNIIVEDIRTRWNSTYDMIEAMCEKREVLKVMASDHLNTNRANFLIEDEEWELLKMFADKLLAFLEATQVFSMWKSIMSPNALGLYELLDGYYVAYKPITLSSILFIFVEMKFIHCHSCVMFATKSMSMCND